MTIGIVLRSTSPLISARTSRPSIFGRFKSSKMSTGRGASAFGPTRRKNAIASMPSAARCSRTDLLASRKVSSVSLTSPGLSSTNSTFSGTLFQRHCRRQLRAADGQRKAKRGTFAQGRFDRYGAAMPFDDLFADRKSDAGAVKILPLVQSLKHPENSFEELWLYSKHVSLNRKHPIGGVFRRSRDVDSRKNSGAPVLDGITDEVLK